MGFDSPVHWIIVIGVIALLFGGSRVGNLMGELGKGIKSFKQNMAEPEPAKPPQAASVVPQVQNHTDAVPLDRPIVEPVTVRQPETVVGRDATRL